jgi:hypothetical protein
MKSQGIRIAAVGTVFGYAALVFTLLGGVEAVGLALWAISPLTVPLTITLVSPHKRTQFGALGLLLCLAIVGVLLSVWGLVWSPGDYNHLVVVFLPFYQFGFIATAAVILALVMLLRRYARST